MLRMPRLGMINVHASLLPRWRGAAPVHRAVLAGDRETGVTIMRVVRELDAGPMLAVERRAIGGEETSADVERALAEMGAALARETVERLSQGPVPEEPQPDAGVTYADRITKADSAIFWWRSAHELHNQVRGLHPWPHAVDDDRWAPAADSEDGRIGRACTRPPRFPAASSKPTADSLVDRGRARARSASWNSGPRDAGR